MTAINNLTRNEQSLGEKMVRTVKFRLPFQRQTLDIEVGMN
jgi:hypothetical protein